MNTQNVSFKDGVKKYKVEETDLWQTIVSIDQYENNHPMIYSWTFKTEKEAIEKMNFVQDNWNDPPLNKYNDWVIYHRVQTLEPKEENNV